MNFERRSFIISIFFVGSIAFGLVLIPDSKNKEVLIFVIALTVGFGLHWLMRPRLSAEEKAIKRKIDQIKSEGQDLAHEYEADLSVEDLRNLKKLRLFNLLILIFALLLLGAIVLLAIHYWIEVRGKIFIELGTVMMLVLGSVFVVKASLKKIDAAIKSGKKTVVRGIITHKRIEGDETDVHFIEIDQLTITVKKKIYSKYQIGDGVEVHFLKNYHNNVLYEKKIDSMSLK